MQSFKDDIFRGYDFTGVDFHIFLLTKFIFNHNFLFSLFCTFKLDLPAELDFATGYGAINLYIKIGRSVCLNGSSWVFLWDLEGELIMGVPRYSQVTPTGSS